MLQPEVGTRDGNIGLFAEQNEYYALKYFHYKVNHFEK